MTVVTTLSAAEAERSMDFGLGCWGYTKREMVSIYKSRRNTERVYFGVLSLFQSFDIPTLIFKSEERRKASLIRRAIAEVGP